MAIDEIALAGQFAVYILLATATILSSPR